MIPTLGTEISKKALFRAAWDPRARVQSTPIQCIGPKYYHIGSVTPEGILALDTVSTESVDTRACRTTL